LILAALGTLLQSDFGEILGRKYQVSFRFPPHGQIATALGVANVLEGTVRRDGPKI
jgi:hypothetical protein